MLSSPTNTLTCRRSAPCSVSTRSITAGHCAAVGLERVAHRGARLLDRDRAQATRVGQQRARQNDGDTHAIVPRQAVPTTAAFTQQIGGSASAIAFQLLARVGEPKSLPLRVPK